MALISANRESLLIVLIFFPLFNLLNGKTSHIAFSALDDTSHSVHVYNINGTSLGSKYVSGRVTGLTTASEYLVVADDAGDITMSRLNGLKPVFDIPLHVPIQTVVVTSGNTHILAPLRDGRLAVIAVSVPSSNKKHSVLSV